MWGQGHLCMWEWGHMYYRGKVVKYTEFRGGQVSRESEVNGQKSKKWV